MLEKAKHIITKYNDLSKDIASPEIINNHTKLAQLAKEQSDLEPIYRKDEKVEFFLETDGQFDQTLKVESNSFGSFWKLRANLRTESRALLGLLAKL